MAKIVLFLLLQLPLLGLLMARFGERRLYDHCRPGRQAAGKVGPFLDPKVWLYVLCAFLCQSGQKWPTKLIFWIPGLLGWLLAMGSLLS